jgi:hypothetical protein
MNFDDKKRRTIEKALGRKLNPAFRKGDIIRKLVRKAHKQPRRNPSCTPGMES